MLASLFNAARHGFPNKSGAQLAKVTFYYLFLALKNFSRKNKVDFPALQVSSKIWTQYSLWIFFQIEYVNRRDWARTPLIRDVTLVQTKALDKSLETAISKADSLNAKYLATRYSKYFRGYSTNEFENWLSHYLLMLNAFINEGISPLTDEVILCEIGPGFAPVTTLAASKHKEFHSFDTFEMQVIARQVCDKVILNQSEIVYHPTNLTSLVDFANLPKKKYALIAFYSFTEINLYERERFYEILRNSEYSIIASNSQFETVDNFTYLENLATVIGSTYQYISLSHVLRESAPPYMRKHRLYLFRKNPKKN
jgi:hypothetical protein